MMLVLGLDTMMSSVEILLTSIFDVAPWLHFKTKPRLLTTSLVCLSLYTLGLVFCTRAGTYWVELFDHYSGSWAVLVLAMLECVSVAWFYGLEAFRADMTAMLGVKITNHWIYRTCAWCWRYVSPAALLIVCGFSWFNFTGLQFYPAWAHVFGNLLSLSTLSGACLWILYCFLNVLVFNRQVYNM
jgi:SNF family Na+-dependent transporter